MGLGDGLTLLLNFSFLQFQVVDSKSNSSAKITRHFFTLL